MRRREFVWIAGGAMSGWSVAARAQQVATVVRIGVLPATATSPGLVALREGLKELGYVEGRNLAIEARDGGPRNDGLPALAAELVGLRVDVIVTQGPYGLAAAKEATTTIPIVFSGIGANFPGLRSGGNLAGVAEEIVESTVQRLALLKEAVPSLTLVGVLANPGNYGTEAYLQRCHAWAEAAGITLHVYEVRDPNDITPDFAKMVDEHVGGVIAFTDSVIFRQRDVIVQTALKDGLPGAYPYREWVTAGGLLSYGPNFAATLRGPVPAMIDKILRGAKPSELPIEHPKSEFFINLKTAKALGLAVPQSLLARADEVIE
jgi:putative ABC transport system substrate-binding protein